MMRSLSAIVIASTICIASAAVRSAEETTPPVVVRIIDRPLFDQLILKGASGREPVDVEPLTLPQRPLATIPVEGTLRVRLLARPGEEFQLNWSDVAAVRVYEE